MARYYLPTIFDEILEDVIPLRNFFAPFKENGSRAQGSCVEHSLYSVYEDENAVYVEAAVPGIPQKDLQVTVDKGGVCIEGKIREEKKDVTFHVKSSAQYSYWIPLPQGKIDERTKPEATLKNGVLRIAFAKGTAAKPLKIEVNEAS